MLKRSLERLVGSSTKRFPTRADLEEALGDLKHPDGTFNAEVVSEAMFAWLKFAQTGCLFASRLAINHAREGWVSLAIPEGLDDLSLYNLIAPITDALPSALMVTFPYVETADDLVGLIEQMRRLPNWFAREVTEKREPGKLLVGLRWKLPDLEHVSWVLGFGSFDFLPFTRRAPFTALVFRTSPDWPASVPRKKTEGYPEVHLADINMRITSEQFDKLHSRTVELREGLLTGELDSAAKAQVTFSIPESLRPKLVPFA